MTFPVTRKSAVYAFSSSDPGERKRAVDLVVGAYWKPVWKYIQLKWGVAAEDAEDLTQAFFAVAYEKTFFKDYDPSRARFRTFLRVCIDRFAANEKKFASRIKRGGDAEHVPLDFDVATGDETFERECTRGIFNLALDTLQQECEQLNKNTHFRLFERYDLDEQPGSYHQLAIEFGLTTSDVTNYLSWARRRFRKIVMELREQIDPL